MAIRRLRCVPTTAPSCWPGKARETAFEYGLGQLAWRAGEEGTVSDEVSNLHPGSREFKSLIPGESLLLTTGLGTLVTCKDSPC